MCPLITKMHILLSAFGLPYTTKHYCKSKEQYLQTKFVHATLLLCFLLHVDFFLISLKYLFVCLFGCPVEQARNINGAKRPQMLPTPEEEVAGEL